jgi:hypothetical protein
MDAPLSSLIGAVIGGAIASGSKDSEQILTKELREAAASASSARWGGTDLVGAVNWRRRGGDTWSPTSVTSRGGEEVEPRHAVSADVDTAGNAYPFYGAAAEVINRNGRSVFTLFERGIALTLAQFLGLAGGLCGRGFYGPVDIGMAVTGIEGSISAHSQGDFRFQGSPYGEPSARRTKRCGSRDFHADPQSIARELLSRLFSASAGYDFDPLGQD